MKVLRKLVPLAGTALALVLLAACGGSDSGGSSNPGGKQKLVVAIQPTQASTEMLQKAKPLKEYLEKAIGNVDVEIYVPLSQSGVIEALRFGQADVAFMGAWPAQLAIEKAGAELIAAEVREVLIDGKKAEDTYYYSYWIVKKDSPLSSMQSLQGKKACFPSAVSSSGYVGPLGKLVQLKLLAQPERGKEADPRKFFGEVLFGGGYQQCWEALKAGQVDVTVIAGDVSENLYKEVLDNTRVLGQQGPLPSHTAIISKYVKEPMRAKVTEAILGLSAPEHRALMRTFISGIFVGFKKTDAQTHLAAFRGYLDLTGLAFTETVAR